MHPFLFGAIGATVGAVVAQANHRRRSAERLAAATLETLLNAIDANDAVTGAHVRRVAAYALVLADALELHRHQRREVERVALFHDIGKLHEALFDIIHDRDTLTADERRAIATHPGRGAEVLAPLAAFYPDLPDGVLAHHERWDGTGYPHGLRAAQIPLSSRIVAVADTFDAITASRRYHDGEDITRALDAVRRGRGAQFDPRVVDAFLTEAVQRRVRSIMRDARHAVRHDERDQRRLGADRGAPDISFRWRDRIERPHAPAR